MAQGRAGSGAGFWAQGGARASVAVLSISIDGGPARLVRLTQPVTTIGRSVDNVLEVPDPNMSRRHCVVEVREAGEVILTDCNSSNGTRVNGERVVSQELRPGDEVEAGSTVMRFGLSEDELRAANRAAGASGRSPPLPPQPLAAVGAATPSQGVPASALTTQSLQRGGGAPPPPPPPPPPAAAPRRKDPAAPPKAEVAVLAHERDDLRKLLQITKRLNQVVEVRRLLETILDAAVELLAAERGFLILLKGGEMKIELARDANQRTINDPTLRVSTQVCRQVIDSRAPVLTTNALSDERFGRYQSVVGLALRSIVCVPFRIKDDILGTVYLDAPQVGAFSERDVELLEAFSDQAAIAADNARLIQDAKQRVRLEQELRIAAQIQRKLLPRKLPSIPGIEVHGTMHAAKEVGGDYYDLVPAPGGQSLFFCIGDVSGKGVPAGMVMASARSTLRTLVEREPSTREIVVSLNRLLCEDLDAEMFLSFVLLRYDAGRDTLSWTGAGHETMFVWRAATRRVEVVKTGGMVLGITTRMEAAIREQTLELAPGDALVLYTDGVSEAVNEAREQYGLERLQESIERHVHLAPKHALQGILGDVLRWQGRAPARDDITLLVARRTPAGEVPSEVPTARYDDDLTRPEGPGLRDPGGIFSSGWE